MIVTNCTDNHSYKDMAKIFKGLCQAGLWGCFDEFNRIRLPVLSVVAQQVLAITNAKRGKKRRRKVVVGGGGGGCGVGWWWLVDCGG